MFRKKPQPTTHEQQQAQQIAQLTASRRAIADAYEVERARIERDLHDGAQQQFVSALLQLQLAERKAVADPDGALAACVVPVSGQLDLRAAAAVLGVKRLALADLAVVERRTGYVRGGVSPLGQRRPHPVVLDSSALDAELMYVSGGQRGLDVEIAPADLVQVTGAVVAEIAAD